MRRSLSLVSLSLLSLISGCASHGPGTARHRNSATLTEPATAKATPEVVKPGGFGASEAGQKPAKAPLATSKAGTASDSHSDVASKTPDGGKSASTSAARTAAAGTPVVDGGDAPGLGADKGPNDTTAASATAEKAGVEQTGDGKADAAAIQGTVAGAKSKPSGASKPVNGSDPAIIGPPSVGRRSRV